MSRYDKYGSSALELLASVQELVRLEGEGICTAKKLVDSFILSKNPLFTEVYEHNELTVDIQKIEAVQQKIAAQRRQQKKSQSDEKKKIRLADDFRKVLDCAEAAVAEENQVQRAHLLAALWLQTPELLFSFSTNEIPLGDLRLPPWDKASFSHFGPEPIKGGVLETLGRDLTAQDSKYPIVGRDDEIDEMIHVLLKYFKPNPLLLGEAGVGKTAVVEGLAQRIRQGKVPQALRGCRIIELRLSDLIAGTTYHGSYEEKLKALIDELETSPHLILFLDEIHQLIPENRDRNASEALKPALARGTIRCIGATTLADYYRSFQKDSALSRRFYEVRISEPTAEDTLTILEQASPVLEKHFQISLPHNCLKLAVDLGRDLLANRRFPDKAFDLLDQACALTAAQGNSSVSNKEINLVAARLSGNRLAEDGVNLEETLANLETFLEKRVIGQSEAVKAVANTVRLCKRGLDLRSERPDGVFLFVGPTGVGKTALALSLAVALSGSEDQLLRLDMGEFSEPHSVARLIGAPAGYVGYDDEPQLLKYLRNNSCGVLLLDEFEKAHHKVQQCFLQVFDSGCLTDARGDTYSLMNTTIIATANPTLHMSTPTIGFSSDSSHQNTTENSYLVDKLMDLFPQELLGRFDEIVRFQPLNHLLAGEILVRSILPKANLNLVKKYGIKIELGEQLKTEIVDKGFVNTLGVRELQRAFEDLVMEKISNNLTTLLEEHKQKPDGKIVADWVKESVSLQVV